MVQAFSVSEALSDFVDILNEHGPDSAQAAEYRRQFGFFPEFVALMDEAVEVHHEHNPQPRMN